jgi:hypothetical protein
VIVPIQLRGPSKIALKMLASYVVETIDSRVQEGHSEVEMEVVCASASSFAR